MRDCAFVPYVKKMMGRTDLRIVQFNLWFCTGEFIDLACQKTVLYRKVTITRDLVRCLYSVLCQFIMAQYQD